MVHSRRAVVVLVTLVALYSAQVLPAQQSERRVALVIGNGAYAALNPLKNPVNDATDMAAALRRLGYTVMLLTNASQEAIEKAVGDLGAALSGDPKASGLFYYAGHGVQYQGSNYLVPADAQIQAETQLKYRCVSMDFVLDSLSGARNGFNLVILDACRDNPFSGFRSASRGLAVVGTQPPGSIIVYATGAGSVAADGDGRNGVFTEALLGYMERPGLEMNELLNAVGQAVQERTRGSQMPAVYKQYFGSYYLAGAGAGGAAPKQSAPATAAPAAAPKATASEATTATGELYVITEPSGAEVSVDGQRKGTSPLVIPDIPVAKKLRIEARSGNRVAAADVTLDKAGLQDLSLTLQTEKGNFVVISTERAVRVVLDGRNLGDLGNGLFRDVDTGSHVLELMGDGLYWKGDATVVTGKTTEVRAKPYLAVEMVAMQGGTFPMGSASAKDDEKPTHDATVSSFLIGKYEVTQAQYQSVMGRNPSTYTGDPQRPVEEVTWFDAVALCNALSTREGLELCYTLGDDGATVRCDFSKNGYRLPTEAEWEYAARGGDRSHGYVYAGGADLGAVAWYGANSENATHAVGTRDANELGIYDMSGNVAEWCWDWKASYAGGAQTDPTGPESGFARVVRGGSASYDPGYARVTARHNLFPGYHSSGYGIRVVRRVKDLGR